MEVHFDDAVASTGGDASDSLIFFGTPTIDSPLTATLPYGPDITLIDPPMETRFSLISNYDFGTGNTGSYFQFGQDQYNGDGPSRFYSYDLRIITPTNHPPLTHLSDFSGADLISYLQGLQTDGAPISFSEYSDHFDSSTMQYLGGIGYTGTALISTISPAPEPSTRVLTLIAMLVVGGIRALAMLTHWRPLRF